MTNTDEEILREPPMAGSEVDTLTGSLERQRRTFAWKCADLDAAGLTATIGVSTMTLGGVLKHLALVETDWFVMKLSGSAPGEPWESVDFDAHPDWEWTSAAQDTPEQLYDLWEQSVARSRQRLGEALAAGGLDGPSAFTWPDGRSPSLRRILIDVIEEYARHTGHADLLRETVDGRVGEDPPD